MAKRGPRLKKILKEAGGPTLEKANKVLTEAADGASNGPKILEGADGQMGFDFDTPPEAPPIKLGEGADGQMEFDFGGGGSPQPEPTPRPDPKMVQGDDGQMGFDFGDGGPKSSPEPEVRPDVEPDVQPEPQMEGQQEFYTDGDNFTWQDAAEEENRRRRFNEVNEANRGMGSKAWQKVGEATEGVVNLFTGTGDSSKRIAGRKTRNIERTEANLNYMATGEGRAYTKREYYNEVKSRGANVEKDSQKMYRSVFDPDNEISAAQRAAEQTVDETDGIPGWMKTVAVSTAVGVAGYTLGNDDGY